MSVRLAPDAMARNTMVEVSARGRWRTLPALQVGATSIVLRGSWLKVAAIHDEHWLEGELDDPARCIQALRQLGVGGIRPDLFTFAQKLPSTTPKYDYPLEWESVAALRLSAYASWWTGLPRDIRKNVRRAAKRGVTLGVKPLDDDLIEGILGVNDDSPLRQGMPFHHFGKTFEQVKKEQSLFQERSDLICAHLGDELLGFLKIVYCGPIGALVQFITKRSRSDLKPADALLARTVERCAQKGLSYLVYGNFRYGNQPNTSLMEFKRRHGFEDLRVPRYYVPLSRKGAMAMALGLHRDRVGILPRPAILVGRQVRGAWYRLRAARYEP